MAASTRPTRRLTLAFLVLLIAWWAFLLLVAAWGAPILEEKGWRPLSAASFVAPCVAIAAACGIIAWIYRDRQSSEPLAVTALLYAITAFYSFSFHVWSVLGILIGYISLSDPRGH